VEGREECVGEEAEVGGGGGQEGRLGVGLSGDKRGRIWVGRLAAAEAGSLVVYVGAYTAFAFNFSMFRDDRGGGSRGRQRVR